MLLMAGSAEQAQYGETIEHDAMFACPDNASIDPKGRLWITTDGSEEVLGIGDGIYAIETEGFVVEAVSLVFCSKGGRSDRSLLFSRW